MKACEDCGTVHPPEHEANPHYCIARMGEQIERLEAEINRLAAAAEQAINDELEYPGDMPDEMWNEINGDRDATSEALRLTVRLTKQGILERFRASLNTACVNTANAEIDRLVNDHSGINSEKAMTNSALIGQYRDAAAKAISETQKAQVEIERLTADLKLNAAMLAKQHDRNMELETNLSDYKVCVDTANAEIDRLRVQLAGCGVAAMQNTTESIKERAKPGDYGYSASYDDVCRAVDREMSLRYEIDRLTAENKKLSGENTDLRKAVGGLRAILKEAEHGR